MSDPFGDIFGLEPDKKSGATADGLFGDFGGDDSLFGEEVAEKPAEAVPAKTEKSKKKPSKKKSQKGKSKASKKSTKTAEDGEGKKKSTKKASRKKSKKKPSKKSSKKDVVKESAVQEPEEDLFALAMATDEEEYAPEEQVEDQNEAEADEIYQPNTAADVFTAGAEEAEVEATNDVGDTQAEKDEDVLEEVEVEEQELEEEDNADESADSLPDVDDAMGEDTAGDKEDKPKVDNSKKALTATTEQQEQRKRTLSAGNEKKNGFHEFIFPNGDLYSGHWKDDKLHGEGTLEYVKDKMKFVGDFEKGKRKKGEMTYSEGSSKGAGTYSGGWKDDKWNGEGELQDKKGNYKGTFSKNMRDGTGVQTFAETSEYATYDGAWKKDKMHGDGKAVYKEGKDYKSLFGEFANGKFIKGIMIYGDDSKWEGKVKDFKKEGKGKFNFANGDLCLGDFSADVLKTGAMTYTSGNRYVGPFTKGQRHGKGSYVFKDGREVTGTFIEGQVVKGVLNFPGSGSYNGSFHPKKMAVRHGEGSFKADNKTFSGTWEDDVMRKGKLETKDGTFEGEFDAEGKKAGTGKQTLSDERVFEGIFSGGKPVDGSVTMSNGDVYAGPVNAEFKPHGTGSFKTSKCQFDGEFDDGTPTEGKLTFEDSYPDDDGKQRKEYSGTVDEHLHAHGEGTMIWTNGDSYTGAYEDNISSGVGLYTTESDGTTLKGTFKHGKFRDGTIVYGEEANKVHSTYTGEVSADGQRQGQGTLEWREGHSFTGRFDKDQHVEGTYTHSNTTVFEGTFNQASDKEFTSGTMTFPNGDTYKHDANQEGSFPHTTAALIAQLVYESKGINAVAETDLTALDIWPQLPALSTDARLPTTVSERLAEAQLDGGSKAIISSREGAEAQLDGLGKTVILVSAMLGNENEAHEAMSSRFGDNWTMSAPTDFIEDARDKLQLQKEFLEQARADQEALEEEIRDVEEELEPLTQSIGELEEVVRTKEAEDQRRTAVEALLNEQKELIESRQAKLAEVAASCAAIDIVPVLLEDAGETAASEIFDDALSEVRELQSTVTDSVSAHQKLLQKIMSAHTEYTENLEQTMAEAVSSVSDPITGVLDLFFEYQKKWVEHTDKLDGETKGTFKGLQTSVQEFCNLREKERIALAKRLLVGALHAAVVAGDQKAVESILDDKTHKTSPNDVGEGGKNAVHLAVLHGKADLIPVLAKKGGKCDARDENGHTLLWVAIEEKELQCVSVLIKCGADPNQPEKIDLGETILHIMARANQIEIVKLLLECDLNLLVKDKKGNTALAHACIGGSSETVRLLVENGAPPNCPNQAGETPLHLTSDGALVTFLVHHGARPGLKNAAKKKAGDEKALKEAMTKFKKLPTVPLDRKELKEGDAGWVEDDACEGCQYCGTAWSFMTRRHHCRRCGGLCCKSCSTKQAGKNKKRVCDGCYNRLCSK